MADIHPEKDQKNVGLEEPKPDLIWECMGGSEKFRGETHRVTAEGETIQFDSWFASNGERRHVRMSNGEAVTDMNYETDPKTSVNEAINGRLRDLDKEQYSFPGTLKGEETNFFYVMKANESQLYAQNKSGVYKALLPGSEDFKETMKQFEKINFDPPCKPPVKLSENNSEQTKPRASHPFTDHTLEELKDLG